MEEPCGRYGIQKSIDVENNYNQYCLYSIMIHNYYYKLMDFKTAMVYPCSNVFSVQW